MQCVTRDMALDAGFPEMEGMEYSEPDSDDYKSSWARAWKAAAKEYRQQLQDAPANDCVCDWIVLVETLNAEIKRLQSLLDWGDNTYGKVLTRVADLDEENMKLRKTTVRQGELLRECYLLLERYEESYLGPIALLRQRIIRE